MKQNKLNVLLVHGWGYTNYSNQTKSDDAWRNRKAFIKNLSKEYNLFTITLPGFCQQPEPKKPWILEDFAIFLEAELKRINIKPDLIIGYSFGAPIVLRHKLKYKANYKAVFISPAIARKYKKASPVYNKLKHLSKILPNSIQNFLQDKYISKVLKNPFYEKGSYFIKQTYLNIVGLDLSKDLLLLSKKDFVLIFGEKDTATPPNVLLSKEPILSDNMIILKNGTHDIANTNTIELIETIKKFTTYDKVKLRKNQQK